MILTHEEAEAVGRLLAVTPQPAPGNAMGWADVVQFVLLKSREAVSAREADLDRQLRDSEVSRVPVTKTLAELKAEAGR